MGTVWFCLVAIMIAMYVALDGFDLGVGAIHLLVGKTNEEALRVLSSYLYILGMLTSVVYGLYALVLPASSAPVYSRMR